MYKNKAQSGDNNICGNNIAKHRKAMEKPNSQRALADKMQLLGVDLDKNAVQRIESGKRFVTDIEIKAFAKVFGITIDELLK
ncbi:MAG TPA: helix-turn-helix transcriptional regulator [Clostridiales bacterium]|nr:helix-turn-helix transcriptional regulator [Clostridiales bacterium]